MSISDQAPLGLLPLEALRLSEKNLALLGQLGIERVEQLEALPRDQMAQRFGSEVGWRLDQMLGRAAEVITPFHSQPEATASWAFEYPAERWEVVTKVLDILLERLEAILKMRCRGTRLVECVLEQEGMESLRLECSLSRPARSASYLRPLLRTRLEQVRLQAPVRAMCVRALLLERIPDELGNLFDAEQVDNDAALAQLLDSLVARMGREAVTKATFVADPQPELACRFACALEPSPGISAAIPGDIGAYRPLQLFPRPIAVQVVALGTPQRFRHAGTDHMVRYCRGPERIETGWWRFSDIRRDYYLVETSEGTRWWIFQRLDDGRWFLHGSFD